jgi:hypothetical protein
MDDQAEAQRRLELYSELKELGDSRALIELAIKITVAEAHGLGLTWSAVGSALGVSTQAAWERYGPTSTKSGAASLQATLDFDLPEGGNSHTR